MRYRFHVLGIPHTATNKQFVGCAFTQKVLKFVKMMSARGHDIIHYGHEHSDIPQQPNVEHVTVVTDQDHREVYGDAYVDDQSWRELGFSHYYRADDVVHERFSANSIKAIAARKQPNDFLLCFWGWGHWSIAQAHADMIVVEPGIGYGGAWARWRVYESHAIRMALGGAESITQCNQDWYHVVIPNYFDARDFTFSASKSNYILYLGRICHGKGVDIAIDATARAGKQLIIAGQGSLLDLGYTKTPAHVTEVGYADENLRRMLMSQAQALFIASRYGEPFGGVQVEAWLSGTPTITPDYAAFAELNQDGVTGYRCRTMRDFVRACTDTADLDPKTIRAHAQRYTLSRVALEYERYFQDVMNVYTGEGWYDMRDLRGQAAWTQQLPRAVVFNA